MAMWYIKSQIYLYKTKVISKNNNKKLTKTTTTRVYNKTT